MPLSQRLRSPLLPTPIEAALLAIYPFTLSLGSLFSQLGPTSRTAPYSHLQHAHPASAAPSYFAHKTNIFNQGFVKIGWFWTTLAFFVFLFTCSPGSTTTTPPPVATLTPRRVQSLLRYVLLTTWWVLVTRWFFGPAIIDRIFRATGGVCVVDRSVVIGTQCKALGGTESWRGGHDLSGHVFMLALGGIFLGMEIGYGLVKAQETGGGPVTMVDVDQTKPKLAAALDGEVKSNGVQEGRRQQPRRQGQQVALRWSVRLAAIVTILSWWMFLMTAVYFHTWREKFTGLFMAYLGIYLIYYLPRAIPSLRDIIGLPGV